MSNNTPKNINKLVKQHPWLGMYFARSTPDVTLAPPKKKGRPFNLISRSQVSCFITAGEKSLLNEWKTTLKPVFGRKPSTGEVYGFLAEIAKARINHLEIKEIEDINAFLKGFISDK